MDGSSGGSEEDEADEVLLRNFPVNGSLGGSLDCLGMRLVTEGDREVNVLESACVSKRGQRVVKEEGRPREQGETGTCTKRSLHARNRSGRGKTGRGETKDEECECVECTRNRGSREWEREDVGNVGSEGFREARESCAKSNESGKRPRDKPNVRENSFTKVRTTIAKKEPKVERRESVGEEERDENGKSGALILRPDLEEMLKSHKEKRDRTRRRGGIDNSMIHSSANTTAFIHPGVVGREEVDGWKHEANARQETRVASKVGESVKKGAWPNDSAGDLDDAHYEYKRKVRKYRLAEGEDVVEAIEVERMIEEWLEAVGVAIRDEVNPTLGVRRGRERRGHDEARNDEETRWEKERTGTRRDEENKDE
ncbi:hypothetical protein EDB89DRAFT_1906721 [Lactarius sanguifluus]|nr:hypothetical protein EDB89DRAFT_1906721 [Lactarius sanguifluus]